ncbi:ATP-dependent RNA helicase HrpA [Nesterenkonia flava]|uniref:ATP-dependent RNA helicase HrpA n=1 Tax=Nesterenkonia flava TaxID=469799 RepID=A0ABU1FU42_9MICC|nr:ATP-dependent RNA helicase HrpA [Nesterenkonia flava]MDR5711671.1 ATP-dependent RNA helicase HrpA [Nesterenkonia flava]
MPTQTRTVREYTPETLNYPEHLPVTGERETILQALREHQVVVVAGETGSGKTTQLPKMLLEMGLAEQGLIGHTQPRRLAARTVAERLAEELDTQIGETVGYQVRFTAEVGKDTAVKLMTDGILLAEIQRDPLLKKYSAIVIDEAHERSLNIDVILGYLKRILPKRPDLKVVVTSATIDPERFAEHFGADTETPAPIIEVSGRTYPVEIRYRPVQDLETDPEGEDPEERDLLDAVSDAVLELAEEPDGDILIFFPGEREIRDAAEALTETVKRHRRLAHSEVLPLFGRLSLQEQKRVFTPGGRRRIVLATNVAETSLTVPGIKYVIDTGTARISRYSTRTKVQRLPIEPISQASANQRAGRCGRTSDGICIRLYSEEDFSSRPEFTDPEILRTSLASVLLQMSSMGITKSPEDLLEFPFVEKPEAKAVTDAVRLLTELGALEARGRTARVTTIGRSLAQLPVDPRLGRMMVEAARRECLTEVTVLVAGMSIQDVRERPTDVRDEADALHRRFADDRSDFSAMLNLWGYIQEQQRELSSSQFRKLCRREHLNWLRIREWQDLVTQLGELAQQAKLAQGRIKPHHATEPVAKHDAVHQSLLAGLLSHIGLYTPRTRDYQGARGARFAIFPGSGLFKKNHDLVMAAELVETSRLWARTAAAIDPAWAEELGGHLLKRTYSEPTWSSKKGAVVATERLTLFGVPIVADRQILFGRVDPAHAREEFIRRALIEGDWNTRHHFDKRNRQRFAEVEELQERTRRQDLLASDSQLMAFFDERLPASITSQRAFDAWWKKQRHDTPELLDLPESTLMAPAAEQVDLDAFPEAFDHDGLALDLTYAYEAGVTVRVPVLFLNQLQPHRFEWFIPGRRTEMLTALIRSMPKQLRKNFVPAPDVAAQAREQLEADYDAGVSPFRPALAQVLRRLKGVIVEPEVFDFGALPDHLRFSFAVVSERGRILDTSFDLVELQVRFSRENREAIGRSVTGAGSETPRPGTVPAKGSSSDSPAAPAGKNEHHRGGAEVDTAVRNQTRWSFGDIPATISRQVAGREVIGYPALTADDSGVRLTVAQSEAEQRRTHRAGVVALLRAVLPSPQRYVVDHLSNRERLAFGQFGEVEAIVAEATTASLDHLVPEQLPFTAAAFETAARHARAELIETVLKLTDTLAQILTLNTEVRARLQSSRSAALKPAVSDMQAQIDHLVYTGFITSTGYAQLQHMPRYLKAMLVRLDRLEAGQSLPKDTTDMQQVQELEDEFDAAVDAVPEQLPVPGELTAVKWMIEELRVNLFAQALGTAQTVSAKRIRRAIKQAGR